MAKFNQTATPHDSYLDEDGDVFVFVSTNEGFRWYPCPGKGEKAAQQLYNHISQKHFERPVDLVRLSALLRISAMGIPPEEVGLSAADVYRTLKQLVHE